MENKTKCYMRFIESRLYFIRNGQVVKADPQTWKQKMYLLLYLLAYFIDSKLGSSVWGKDAPYNIPIPISEQKGKMLWSVSSMDKQYES